MLDIIIVHSIICGGAVFCGIGVIIGKKYNPEICKKRVSIDPTDISIPIEKPNVVHMIHRMQK
jgi:hypothetical protein